MRAIVAVDKNWGIGNQGKLLVSIPKDHKMFRQTTMGKVLVYGRKTLDTFPMRKPLDKRTNIILSRNLSLSVEGALVAHSLDELQTMLQPYPAEDVYVIGGAQVYEELLPYIDLVEVTKVDYAYAADAFFHNLDQDPAWKVTKESDEETYFNVPYTFMRYERI